PALDDQTDASSSDGAVTNALLGLGPALEPREVVKVNNASVTEMKHACDDALKRFLSRPVLFNQIHTHTDVRLGLGWASVFVAGGTGLYGWNADFEKSKPLVWAGLILYLLLTILQALYAYFIEGDIVFVGKRKTFDKRIMTERITLTSTTKPSSPSSPPAYTLALTYVRSASGGKSLLGRGRASTERGYNTFFDSQGVMDQEGFERWVGALVEGVMVGKGE
ncbi:microsomal signal peptidase 25 kDa subunit-domain-containing protein, partial [Amylocystis lapponica]